MAQISPDLQWRYGLMIGRIPEAIRARIDSDELTDRVLMTEALIRKADAATTEADRKRFRDQAQRVMGARPRAETEAIVVAKMRKAKIIHDPIQAAHLERQAREELELNPPAVRRSGSKRAPVIKADDAADVTPVIVLYDADGNPAYAIDPDSADLTPLTTGDAIAKAQRQRAKGRR
jgi:hypothetical protein